MTKIAYFDCFSGASGDMLLGAFLDAGFSLDTLKEDLAKLGLSDYEIILTPQVRHSISGSKLDVVDHSQERPAHNLHTVRSLLEGSSLPPEIVELSLQVFTRLAEAEAQVHKTDVAHIHFHEVGAVDTLVDIVGFCSAIWHLGIKEIYASFLPLGKGTVITEHGLLPVPAPATLALLASAQVPVLPLDIQSELVTPTGAALLSTLAHFSRPAMIIQRVGYGFGSETLPWPNMVRVWIGEKLFIDSTKYALAFDRHSHHQETTHTHEHPPEHTHGPHTHEHSH
ncbi:MAG: LarC family nickel insertion protein [Anaerolineae bacterium]|nr:LarC family nickel insertion protein [Anaerolineae bacterium]